MASPTAEFQAAKRTGTGVRVGIARSGGGQSDEPVSSHRPLKKALMVLYYLYFGNHCAMHLF